MQANPYFLEDLAARVDQAIANAKSKDDFIAVLEAYGYFVKWDTNAKTITFITPDGAHVRNRRLKGKTKYDCSVEALCQRFGEAVPLRVYGVRHFGSRENLDRFCQEYAIAPDGQRYIYVLGLQGGCFYVGQTSHFKNRMTRHFAKSVAGSSWTEANTPFHLLEVIDMGGMDEASCCEYETAKTISYMTKHGVAFVRGGELCQADIVDVSRHLLYLGFGMREQVPYPVDIKARRWAEALQRLKGYRVAFDHRQR